MGLTFKSTGKSNLKENNSQKVCDISIALAGNPNVGKSTVFNALTGMHQHTGNWTGKTVSGASGFFKYKGKNIRLTDIPGCYSLNAYSPEEEIARDILCYGAFDKTVIVCDATCLKRNLTLVLQTAEMLGKCIVCINLEDEARLRNITINTEQLSKELSLPVVSTTARSGKGLNRLCEAIISPQAETETEIEYPTYIEQTIKEICTIIEPKIKNHILNTRWIALKLLENNDATIKVIEKIYSQTLFCDELSKRLKQFNEYLSINTISKRQLLDTISNCVYKKAEKIANLVVKNGTNIKEKKDLKVDKLLTGKLTAFPIMFLMLMVIFYITISGANIPSKALSNLLFSIEKFLYDFSIKINVPSIICEALFHGVFRTVAWIVAVMLPPMAIFFPLFTLLEDSGILPRIAFNLDRAFLKCNTCGKQALTMCMGFGCNAAGVVGCRIINSPRERLIAIVTNSLVPCNGRFPGIISMITMFLIFGSIALSNIMSAAILSGFIVFSIVTTLLVSKILSKTLLKGVPSAFTLELPPYRRPQFIRVLINSVFDRTLFVLSRAIVVAAPAGLIIWLAANIQIADASMLSHIIYALEPFGKMLGLDGVIITAFILGFPANEIVIPIMLMGYTAGANLVETNSILVIKNILLENNWSILTALNFIIFSLFHFPCSTTILTIKKETGSIFWTVVSFLLPTLIGITVCTVTNLLFKAIF